MEAAGVEPEKPAFSNVLTARRLWSQLLRLLEFDVDDRVPQSPHETTAIDPILGEMLEAAGTVRLVSRRSPEAVRGPAASKDNRPHDSRPPGLMPGWQAGIRALMTRCLTCRSAASSTHASGEPSASTDPDLASLTTCRV